MDDARRRTITATAIHLPAYCLIQPLTAVPMKNVRLLIFFLTTIHCSAQKAPRTCYSTSDKQAYLFSETSENDRELLSKGSLASQSKLYCVFIWTNERVYRLVGIELPPGTQTSAKTTDLAKTLEQIFADSARRVSEPLIYSENLVNIVNANLKSTVLAANYTSHGTSIERQKPGKGVPLFFPVLFKNTRTGGTLALSVFYINVYDRDQTILQVSHYNLKGTIYLPDGVIGGSSRTTIDNSALSLALKAVTLPAVTALDTEVVATPVSTTEFLATFDLKQQSFYQVDSSGVVLSTRCEPGLRPKVSENACTGPPFCQLKYEYDDYCYNPTVSKSLRIFNHCPFMIGTTSYSYVWSQHGDLILKAESRSSPHCSTPPWQLIVPGRGYWMSNVRTDESGSYFIPVQSSPLFEINEVTLQEFFRFQNL